MAAAPLFAWPWEILGSGKVYKRVVRLCVCVCEVLVVYICVYMLKKLGFLWLQIVVYGAFLGKAMYSRYVQEEPMSESWCLHIFIMCMLRILMYQTWASYSNMLFLTRNRRIVKNGVDFKQIDQEWNW